MEEIVIIGSGCAGLSAAIYAARAGLNPVVIEGSQPGGQIITTTEVENFPSWADGIAGFDLTWNMRKQAEKFGTKLVGASVEKVDFSGDIKKIFCDGDIVFETKNVIIATGAAPRMTGAKNEEKMYGGKGVSTCATCDGAFFRNMPVCVVGGGDTACEEAMFLSRLCSEVYLVHRRREFRASKIMDERVRSNPKIKLQLDSVIDEVLPDENGKCRGVKIRDVKTGEEKTIDCKALFLAIGHIPNTGVFKGQVELDSEGFVKTLEGSMVKTSVKNVLVAGDCADRLYRQAITASAMGVMAALTIINDL